MKRCFKLFIILISAVFIAQVSRAEEYKVLVLPDNIQFDSTNYYIYPDSSVIFASDTINQIKKDDRIKTVSMTEIRDALRKNTKLSILTKSALKEYKYNYNIPFVDFKSIARCFDTNKILVITSQTDVQNYFLRRTLWDFFNIPGAAVIDPAYKLSTFVSLIDVDKELVLWQNTYYKTISSKESRMIAGNFAPATEQLEKIKNYSSYLLSPHVAKMVETSILPPPVLTPENGIMEISNQKQDETILPIEEEIDIKPKTIIPSRIKPKSYGAIINDL